MFGTSGIRGAFGTDVTAKLALSIGRAITMDGADSVVIGHDPRLTGELLVDAVSAGIRECGGDVIDVGMASTPAIARGVTAKDADVGVSVTASHNPPADNGIKLWSKSGMAFDEERRARITKIVESTEFEPAPWDRVGDSRSWDGVTAHHRKSVVEAVRPLVEADDNNAGASNTTVSVKQHENEDVARSDSGLTVVVDVGNGAGGVTAAALRELGFAVETLNAEPDGRFPARPSEPTAENCRTLSNVVESTGASLGIAHDGDADRMLAVDDRGDFLSGDVLLALFARAAIRAIAGDQSPEADLQVAAPLNTSLAVDEALESVGGTVVRTRVGDVFVAERARESDVVFGGEPSGAWIWPDETLCPDGTLAACKLAALVARMGPLSSLAAEIKRYPLRRESRPVDDTASVMSAVSHLATDRFETVEQLDGVRIETDSGWLLIRASGTQPLIRLTAEARDETRTEELLGIASSLVEEAIGD